MNVLIDGNAIGHACHRATRLTIPGSEFETQAIFGFIKTLRGLRVGLPQAKIVVLWDGYAKHRFEILPDYKGDRARKEASDPAEAKVRSSYRAQVPLIKKAVELLGVRQMQHPDLEADDLAGWLCKYTSATAPALLVTGDSDWLQLVSEHVSWLDPRKEGKRITLANFHEATGYHTPVEYLHGKALIGDSTDSIPGVDGIGETTAALLLARFGSIDNFYRQVADGTYTPASRKSKTAKSPHPEQFLASDAGKSIFERNMKLMDLRHPRDPSPSPTLTPGVLNIDKFTMLCARLGFASITRDIDTWARDFAPREAVALAA